MVTGQVFDGGHSVLLLHRLPGLGFFSPGAWRFGWLGRWRKPWRSKAVGLVRSLATETRGMTWERTSNDSFYPTGGHDPPLGSQVDFHHWWSSP